MKKIICFVLVLTLLISGCSNKEEPEEKPESTADEQVMEKEAPKKIYDLDIYLKDEGLNTLDTLEFADYNILITHKESEEYQEKESGLPIFFILTNKSGEHLKTIDTSLKISPTAEILVNEEEQPFLVNLGNKSKLLLFKDENGITALGNDISESEEDSNNLSKVLYSYINIDDKKLTENKLQMETSLDFLDIYEKDKESLVYNEANKSVSLEKPLLYIKADKTAIDTGINYSRIEEIVELLPQPKYPEEKEISTMIYSDDYSSIVTALSAVYGSKLLEEFDNIEDASDDFFALTGSKYYSEIYDIDRFEDNPDYQLIKDMSEIDGCGDCYLPIEQVEDINHHLFNVSRDLSGYTASKDDKDSVYANMFPMYFSDTFKFFYATHAGYPSGGTPVLLASKQEGDTITAYVAYTQQPQSYYENQIGRTFASALENAKANGVHKFQLKKASSGNYYLSSHHIVDEDLSKIIKSTSPKDGGKRMEQSDHKYAKEFQSTLKEVTKYCHLTPFGQSSESGSSMLLDTTYQLFMTAVEKGEYESVITKENGTQFETIHVKKASLEKLGNQYFGNGFVLPDSEIVFSLESSPKDMFLANPEYKERVQYTFDGIIDIQELEKDSKYKVVTVPLILVENSDVLYSGFQQNKAVGYLKDISVNIENVDDIYKNARIIGEYPKATYVFEKNQGIWQIIGCEYS